MPYKHDLALSFGGLSENSSFGWIARRLDLGSASIVCSPGRFFQFCFIADKYPVLGPIEEEPTEFGFPDERIHFLKQACSRTVPRIGRVD